MILNLTKTSYNNYKRARFQISWKSKSKGL